MNFNIDVSSEVPIYIQIRNNIILGMAYGTLKENDKLPTVRQLAKDTGINNMTVSKAYTYLKNEGLINIDRRNGARIKKVSNNSENYKQELFEKLELLIAESKINGLSKSDFLDICSFLFYKMKGIQ